MGDDSEMSLIRRLRREILFARERVYRVGAVTPLEEIPDLGALSIFVKREDLSPIKAYKWRGAFNRMAMLDRASYGGGVVTASAGNHAQGVALAAAKLGIKATIYMPRTTPEVKQRAVRRLGGEWVQIVLFGDAYDEAYREGLKQAKVEGAVYIHAYDDLYVMAGQGTLADEVVMSGKGPFDVAYLQIGGGGMAAGVSAWLKEFYPGIEIIGVEGEDQASMGKAVEAGERVVLESLDIFCDGTAVRQAGELPYAICKETVDRFMTVTNGEVSDAIRVFWDHLRCLPEPSGAMGLAGALKEREGLEGKRVLVVLCGANIDFSRLATIASSAGIEGRKRHNLRIEIKEEQGAMLELLDTPLGQFNIVAFQYGKVDETKAWPVFGVACSDLEMEGIGRALEAAGYRFEVISENAEVQYRLIPFRSELLASVLFLDLEFYERPGALHAFLTDTIRGRGSFCYFNYAYSGERVGRALIGMDFGSEGERDAFAREIPTHGEGYRRCRVMDGERVNRLLGRGSEASRKE